jgi:hypothetical protein
MDGQAKARQVRLDLSWVHERLAIGGALDTKGAAALLLQHGVRCVVDVRDEQCDDETELRAHGMELLHFPTPDQRATSIHRLAELVDWITPRLARGDRVFVHCEHGVGRSALVALCVLVKLDVAPSEAMWRLKQARPCAAPSPCQLDTFVRWSVTCGKDAPSWSELARIVYGQRRMQSGEYVRM